ncbi:MAG: histidinol-phosphatase [Eubacteriales bacterium]
MSVISNFHTHTVYSDGKDAPEDIVMEAIRLGCSEIGFSDHSYTDFDTSYCMPKEKAAEYKREIKRLKEKYKGRIKIYLGIEQDYYSAEPTDDYDYIIGSVHYVKKDGAYIPVDESAKKQIDAVNALYGGDFYAFIDDYYKTVSDVYQKTKCDIIGHFDLVTKFNQDGALFDTSDKRYKESSSAALEKLINTPALFEINTGAISRGYRKTSYPESVILDRIAKSKKPFILSSDSHKKETLLFELNSESARLTARNYPYIKSFSQIKQKPKLLSK